MLILAPPAVGVSAIGPGSGVVLVGGDSSFASKLAGNLASRDGAVRRLPVLESWDGLKDVSRCAIET